MIDFASYPSVLAASLSNAIKEPHTFLAVFIMNRDGQGRLDFIQNVVRGRRAPPVARERTSARRRLPGHLH